VDQRLNHTVLRERFEVTAGFAEFDAPTECLPNTEPVPDPVVQCDALRREVSQVFAGTEFDSEIFGHGTERLSLDQHQVGTGTGLPRCRILRPEMAITAEASAGNRVDGPSGFNRFPGGRREVNCLDGTRCPDR